MRVDGLPLDVNWVLPRVYEQYEGDLKQMNLSHHPRWRRSR